MRYAAKYRRKDGGVVSRWKGPDRLPVHTPGGRPVLEPAPTGLGTKVARALGFGVPVKMQPQMADPIPAMLECEVETAVEIDEATYNALATITAKDGRLLWRVVDGEVRSNDADLYSGAGPVTDAPKTNAGVIRKLRGE